jgi:hypothetical protein
MNAQTPPASPVDPADRSAARGAQVAQLIFLAFSCLFVVSSTWQFTRAVFFPSDASQGPQPASGELHPPCAETGAAPPPR